MTAKIGAVPLLSHLLNDHLRLKRDAMGDREIVGGATWRASEMGQCPRAVYIRRVQNRDPLRVLEVSSLRRFEVGHFWAWAWKRWFEEMGLLLEEEYELYDPILDVGVHCDFFIGNHEWRAGVELKSMQSSYFEYRAKEKAVTVATEASLIQAATCDVLARRQGLEFPWVVLTVSKDDLRMYQDPVTEEHREKALSIIETLNTARTTGIAPPCTCKDPNGPYNGRAWRWCDYYEGSDESRSNSVSERNGSYSNGKAKYSKVYKPDGDCCRI